jgi:CheY-like chemotaxis protein
VEALEYLRDPGKARPDLIVLDLNMPRMGGQELLEILKADTALQIVPAVVLSTSKAPEDVAGAYAGHANAYVTKPVDLDDFNDAVRNIDAFFLDIACTAPRTVTP